MQILGNSCYGRELFYPFRCALVYEGNPIEVGWLDCGFRCAKGEENNAKN